MMDARERSEWTRASALMALIANAHRDPRKGRAFKPSDFDPFANASAGKTAIRADVSVLKDVFIHGRAPTEKQRGDQT